MASLEHGILKDFHTKQFSSREIPQKKKGSYFPQEASIRCCDEGPT